MQLPIFEAHGVKVTVAERRRYGGRNGVTYTWLHFERDGFQHWTDPWPCLRPTNRELESTCASVAAGHYDWQKNPTDPNRTHESH